MNYKDLENLLAILKEVPDSDKRDEGVRLMLQTASDSITFDSLQALLSKGNDSKQDESGILLKLPKKEISKLPMRFRKEFLINDCMVKCRRRQSGRKTINYEIRYRKHGYKIAVSSNDMDKAITKFIQALIRADKNEPKPTVPTDFAKFSEYYFNNYRKRKVAAKTFENDMYRYNKHIKPYFGSMQMKDVTPSHCQKLLDVFAEKGQTKTNNEVYSLLNGIFKMAIAHNLITKNPLSVVIIEKHKRTHGKALTKEEERRLLDYLKSSRYLTLFTVVLYTGLRPNEYKTARIENGFIVAVNSKQKNGKVAYKKIPVTPMLKPYLNGVTELNFPRVEYIRDKLKEVLPNHKLYDLRTTFYTRCKECGIADVAIKKFVGHSLGGMADTYTDLSEDFLLREGSKFKY